MQISADNKLQHLLDFDVCKRMVEEAEKKGDTCVILCPHYSINIQSNEVYEDDGEALNFDLDELGDYIGHMVAVSDFDDLIVDLSTED